MDSDTRLAWEKVDGLERYRMLSHIKGSRKIDIYPTKQTKGISTGLVIAYGHVVPPPYRVEYEEHRLLINGVQVFPSLVLQQIKPLTPSPRAAEIKNLSAVFDAMEPIARKMYSTDINKKPLADVQAEIKEFILSSTNSITGVTWINDRIVHYQFGAWGGEAAIRFTAKLPKEQTPEEIHTSESIGEQKAMSADLAQIQKGLESGGTLFFFSDGFRAMARNDVRSSVNAIMATPGLSKDQRIEMINKKLNFGYAFALDVIDNYSSQEWRLK